MPDHGTPTPADTRVIVLDLLTALGDTPDAVADRLLALDIRGTKQAACDCPLANYLTRNLWDGAYVSIGGYGTVCVDNEIGNNPVIVELPQACHTFVLRFDRTDIYDRLVAAEVTA